MISVQHQAARDREQRERKELAKGAWRDGVFENALIIIRSVLAEEMSPAVAAECYVMQAAILADMGEFRGSLESLTRSAPFIDVADIRIQGCFYNHRARAHKNLGDAPSALIDYAGAVALWQACGDKDYEGAAAINLAELYLSLNDLTQANQSADHALKVLPPNSDYLCDAHDTKAKILLAKGMPELALDFIDCALDLKPQNRVLRFRFLRTKVKIKRYLRRVLISSGRMKDVQKLKVEMIARALNTTNGSITAAAKMLGTSHQVVAYIADSKKLPRSKRKKSIIKALR